MESLAPPMECLIEVRSSLFNGEPVRAGLLRYACQCQNDFASDVRRFIFDWDQGRDWRPSINSIKSPYRRALLELAACGLAGQSIQNQLEDLAKEIECACESEIKSRIEMLPFRMLIPLVFMLFPSYLVLLFGPLLRVFLSELAR